MITTENRTTLRFASISWLVLAKCWKLFLLNHATFIRRISGKFSDLCLCLFVWFIYTYKVMLQSWTHTQFTIWSKQKRLPTPIFMLSTNLNKVSFVENNHISFTLSLLISITFLTECNVINFMEEKTNYFLINGWLNQ